MAKEKREVEIETKENTDIKEEAKTTAVEPTFTKEQFLKSKRFERYRDYLTARLEGKPYTIAEVEQIIQEVQ